MTATKDLLPGQFADLESLAQQWCLPTEPERYDKRLASSMDELQTFYDALFPRLEEALTYCDQYRLNALPDQALNLMHLLYSLVAVSFSVEAWGQGRIPDTGASSLPCLVEPVPLAREAQGPVLAITPFETDQDAIDIANNSRYDLSGYVHTSDVRRATRIAEELNSGEVLINGGANMFAKRP
jgi:hypothetical protein